MSLFGKLAALFGGGGACRVCVVDGDRLAGGDKVGPGERFQALSKLARFASREEMGCTVVFGGRPLREADEGADYNGVKVFYGESAEDVKKKIGQALSSAGSSRAVLVTSDSTLEVDFSGRGFATMKTSTLRKAMEANTSEGGGGGGRDRGDREGGRNRGRGGRGRGRRGGDRQGGNGGESARGQEGGQSRPAEGNAGGGNDSVKNLIDLVE